jgi:hypothetical protein
VKSFYVPIPDPLLKRLVAHAEAIGTTPSELVQSILSMPLELIAQHVAIKCEACGRPWVAHTPECFRHPFRPGWSRLEP